MACTDADFEFLREVVQSESAMVLSPSRDAQFESRLAPVALSVGASGLEDLILRLRGEGKAPMRRAVAEAMVINETSFFRDKAPFHTLRDLILPALIAGNSRTRRLRIWSAASSTGQEAYSIAMLLLESFPEVASTWDVEVLGTDISQSAVEYARAARYKRLEVNRGLPAQLVLKYLSREGEEWSVTEEVRRLCVFQTRNLRESVDDLPHFDLILLRNVLLYFSNEDRSAILGGIHQRIGSSGYLLLGAAEQAEESTDLFRAEFARDCYFYRPELTS